MWNTRDGKPVCAVCRTTLTKAERKRTRNATAPRCDVCIRLGVTLRALHLKGTGRQPLTLADAVERECRVQTYRRRAKLKLPLFHPHARTV